MEENLYTYKTLITLIVCLFVWLFVCLFETVHTNPGYGTATLIYNNLLNLISATEILLRSSNIIIIIIPYGIQDI